MQKKLKDCDPSVCNRETLMTGDGTFVYADIYKNNCEKSCKLKSTCGVVISLLEKGKHEEAVQTLKNSQLCGK